MHPVTEHHGFVEMSSNRTESCSSITTSTRFRTTEIEAGPGFLVGLGIVVLCTCLPEILVDVWVVPLEKFGGFHILLLSSSKA